MKLQSFYIFKFDSRRLKESHYKINLDITQARKNNELISIAYNQVIKTIFRLKNRNFQQKELESLLETKKKIARLPQTKDNQIRFEQVSKDIDDTLFIPELISIQFDNKSHYEKIKQNGLLINGKSFVRLLAGAGNIRKNTVIFCDSEIRDRLVEILDNGRDKSKKLVPAKYNAYFSLLNSSTLPVSFPKFCVVKDCTMQIIRPMDYITEDDQGRDIVDENRMVEINANSFDGQGLISPLLSEKWAKELELDYTPANFIIRAPFIKGMVVTFDFHKFAREVAKTYKISDIYGNIIDVNDVELIISESQFKLWQSYPSLENYIENCNKNELGFGISRPAPKNDKTYARSNYQFLQVLKLDDEQIKKLCEPTVNHFKYLMGEDPYRMILYSLGDTQIKGRWFERLDATTKALIINPEVANDAYIHNSFTRSLNKKIRESYLGSLYFEGNYSILISDPYAQAQHIFGLPVTGLLKENQHYSSFWNRRGKKQVVACRAPLTFQSEVVKLNLQNEDVQNDWYSFISTGIIIPAFGIGIDPVRFADADHDGDLVATYYHPAFLEGVQEGLPITYEKKSANKIEICDDILIDTDIQGFGCKVGYITNVSSSMYCQIEKYPVGSKERETVFNRLKIARKLQGDAIDSGKGIVTKPFPDHWVKWRRVKDDMDDEEKEQTEFDNSIVVEKRPLFFRFLYPDYQKRYDKEIKRLENKTMTKYGLSAKEFFELKEYTEEQQKMLEGYYHFSFFLHEPSVMNQISKIMQAEILEAKQALHKSLFDYNIYINPDIAVDPEKLDMLLEIYLKFKKHSQSKLETKQDNYNDYLKGEAEKITSNMSELANLAVTICYENNPKSNKSFCWEIASDGIIENLLRNTDRKIMIPVSDTNGSIEYLWSRYSLKEFDLETL